MHKWLITIFCSLMMTPLFALQIKNVINNETTSAKISSVDVTRIFVQGDRIKSIKGIKGAYTRENDEQNGEIYIQPTSGYQFRPFTILISTEKGCHFTLLLHPTSSPSETLMLVPKGVGQEGASRFEKASPYELTLTHLIRAMKNGVLPEGYVASGVSTNKNIQYGKHFIIKLKTVYQGLNLRGEIFEIKNRLSTTAYIDEKEFYKKGARAISLDAIVIPPYQKVNLYRVISHE